MLLDLFEDDFFIRQGALCNRRPVDDALAPVDQTFVIKTDKHIPNCLAGAFVHCKECSVPICRHTKRTKLLQDDTAVAFLPLPDIVDKCISSKVVAREPFLFEFLLDLGLCCNSGMVDARKPTRFLSVLACPADIDILNGVIQDVPEMQNTRYIGRRHQDRI